MNNDGVVYDDIKALKDQLDRIELVVVSLHAKLNNPYQGGPYQPWFLRSQVPGSC